MSGFAVAGALLVVGLLALGMGYGGRWLAMLQLRRELQAVAACVDPQLLAKVTGFQQQLVEGMAKIDQCDRAVKSLSGRFGDAARREKLGPGDVELIASLVATQLGLRAVVKPPVGAGPEAVQGVLREIGAKK